MIIMIDAGHGIETAGKRAPDGSYLEYEFNRDVAGRISGTSRAAASTRA